MARKIEILVGGERARIRLSVQGGVLKIVTSRCYAEFVKRMKLASEHKRWPVAECLGDRSGQPILMPTLAESMTMCKIDMGPDQPLMPVRMLDEAYNHIVEWLAGKTDLKDGYDSQVVDPMKPKMYTPDEIQTIAAEAARVALAAAGHVAPELVEIVETEVSMPEPPLEAKIASLRSDPQLSDYDMGGRSAKEIAFAEALLNGVDSVIDAAFDVGYKRPRGVVKRLMKVPVLKQIVKDMGCAMK